MFIILVCSYGGAKLDTILKRTNHRDSKVSFPLRHENYTLLTGLLKRAGMVLSIPVLRTFMKRGRLLHC